MKIKPNKLKQALNACEMQIGLWLGSAQPVIAEIAANSGYDWCLIDAEHGPNDVHTVLAQLQAMNGAGAAPVVRVPVGQDWLIKQVLDIGAQTIMVPMVETAKQAAECARSVRYPPDGARGLAAPLIRASGFNAVTDYAATANGQICLIVQIESRVAIENIDAIAATEGVDVVFIGPADLSADMGYIGNADAPEVLDAIEHAVARITAAGKVAGIIPAGGKSFAYYRDLGVRFMGVGSDVLLLAEAIRRRAADVRAELTQG